VNHCLLEVEVLEAPQVRYTQDNQTPVAEMTVRFDGLRPDDPPGQIRVVGWGSLAQDLQNRVKVGQRLVLEGRLRMNTVSRPDGVKEKRAEFTLSRLHPTGAGPSGTSMTAESRGMEGAAPAPVVRRAGSVSGGTRPAAPAPIPTSPAGKPAEAAAPVWNTSPLVADPEGFDEEDDIPF
jgi:single-strand DNA-binding protein